MGGLAASIRLAAAGHTVQIFEKNQLVGGKLNLLEQGGYRWDTGPSLHNYALCLSRIVAGGGQAV